MGYPLLLFVPPTWPPTSPRPFLLCLPLMLTSPPLFLSLNTSVFGNVTPCALQFYYPLAVASLFPVPKNDHYDTFHLAPLLAASPGTLLTFWRQNHRRFTFRLINLTSKWEVSFDVLLDLTAWVMWRFFGPGTSRVSAPAHLTLPMLLIPLLRCRRGILPDRCRHRYFRLRPRSLTLSGSRSSIPC
jgi:hypothetical protein